MELRPYKKTKNSKMDKTALKHKILTLEGLTNEEKSALLELLNKQKKYGLVWEEKPEDVEERLRDSLPVFKEVKERSILSDSPDAPNHILIEGDNLEALTALSYTHEGKIDVIYIDPPYNTGKKDEFKYNDNYVDSEDAYRHSKWLSFMDKRLRIAKNLLASDGIVFISIDDNEVAQLKMICDKIFTHDSNPKNSNCLGILIWDLGTGTQAGHFTRAHEYVLCYVNNKSLLPNFSGGEGEIDHSALKKISKKNPPIDYRFKAGTKFLAPDGKELFGKWGQSETSEIIEGRMVAEKQMLKYDVTIRAGFAMISQMKSWFNGNTTYDSKGQLVTDFYFNENGVLHYKKDRSVLNPPSVIKGIGSTKTGSTELANIIGNNDKFGYPKPSSLIKNLISLVRTKKIILDFFAGSGTTLHATMQLNSEDGGHRQCILVTNNENKICEEVTYERNKRVINGYTTPKGEQVEGLKNNSLRYYKTELLPREKSPRNMRALMAAATELLCIKEDLYEESKRFGRYRTNPKTIRYFEKGDKRMLIIFCEELADQIAEEIKTLDFGGDKLKVYIFSPDRYAFDDNFYEVQDKVTLVALPAAIYDAYRRVLPKRIDKPLLEVIAEERLTSPVQQTIDFESNNDNAQ